MQFWPKHGSLSLISSKFEDVVFTLTQHLTKKAVTTFTLGIRLGNPGFTPAVAL